MLPYLQVDQSAFARASELAAMLEVEQAQALGHLVMLWRWALDLGPDDKPPHGIVSGRAAVVRLEAGAGWTGERGALSGALVDLGLVTAGADSLRVHGLGRYEKAHEKQLKEKARKAKWRADAAAKAGQDADGTRDVRGTSAGQDADGTGTSGPKREMKMKMESKRKIKEPLTLERSSAGADAPQLLLLDDEGGDGDGDGDLAPDAEEVGASIRRPVADAPAIPKPRKLAPSAEFVEWANADRLARRPMAPLADALNAGAWARIADAIRAHGLLALKAAWNAYCADPGAIERDLPVAMFVAQAGRWVTEGQRQKAGAPAPRRSAPIRAQDVDWTQEAGESPF